jgi:RimJ/RimL family protein N-acetyltransferase
LAAAWADPEVVRWTGVPERTDVAAARRWIEGDATRRARGLALDLVIDVEGAVVGEVGLSGFLATSGTAEIGWWVAPSHRRCGVAARAAALVAAWAVTELCITTAVARCDPANPGSGGVARAAGFTQVDDTEVWVFAAPG